MDSRKLDLTVACFLWGLWGSPKAIEYVNRLKYGVGRNLSIPHRFVCFSDRTGIGFAPGIEVIPLSTEEMDFRWNLTKMVAYKPDNGLTGRVLLFDLDVVVIGDLDEMAGYDGQFITCEGAYHKGRPGGSIIGFEAGWGKDELWMPLMANRKFYEAMTDGSERKYFNMVLKSKGHPIDFWQDKYPGQVLSYKLHCEGTSIRPNGARVVRFHGKPRPHEADKNNWVIREWTKWSTIT